MRCPNKYSWLPKPSLPKEMLLFNRNQGFFLKKANLINFWLMRVAVVKTEGTNNSHVG